MKDIKKQEATGKPAASFMEGRIGGGEALELTRQNTGQMAPRPSRPQTPDTEIFETPPSSSDALLRALDPNFGRGASAPIQEDWAQIEANLAHASSPKTQADLQTSRQQQELAMQQAKIKALQEQMLQNNYRRQYQRQINVGARIPGYSNHGIPRQPLDILHRVPDSYLKQKHGTPINLTDKLRRGEPLSSLNEWNQFAHTLHMHYLTMVKQGQEAEANAIKLELEKAIIAILTGPNALRTEDGYIVIGNRAYGTAEASQKSREFIDSLVENEQFPPSRYPHIGPKNTPLDLSGLLMREQNYYRQNYPDVTEQYNKVLVEIKNKTKQAFLKDGKFSGIVSGDGVYPVFKRNFGNNKPWDLQVNNELPGQAVLFNLQGEIQYENNGYVKTTDEFSIYNK
ncbi:MAG: hypothetical protein IPK79_08345 [Vampirovibrionales bacterium]|nr:hypothetical protein [Vampirovibrionales bacterium]